MNYLGCHQGIGISFLLGGNWLGPHGPLVSANPADSVVGLGHRNLKHSSAQNVMDLEEAGGSLGPLRGNHFGG